MIKSLFNVGHMHLQKFHYIAQANKNQPWNIIDIIITMLQLQFNLFIIHNYNIMSYISCK